MHLDILSFIKSLGYAGVWGLVFLESGIPFCFFFPGDSLLFTAGFLASQGYLSFPLLVAGSLAAAILGNGVGYWIGAKIGMRLYNRPDSRFLKRRHLDMTHRFYEKHGALAVISARFMPIIRTFIPFLAGIVRMDRRQFGLYTAIGGAAWTLGLPLLGYFLGRLLPPGQVDRYLLPIILAIIVLSLMPSAYHFHKERKASTAARS
jgi:membrane-associated protein